VIVVAACAALVVLLVIIRRLLRVAIVAIVLMGAAFSCGILTVPQAISGPIDHLQTEVHSWQKRQSTKLACSRQDLRSAESAEAPEPSPSCSKEGK